ncbi:MAG: hypothetical protein IT227_13625 [Flavobacteriales bacterium]|nr:hypothetical protein [Flavobacteriales bacterium]
MHRRPFSLGRPSWRPVLLAVAVSSALVALAGAPHRRVVGPVRSYSHPLVHLLDHGAPDSSAHHAVERGSLRSSR